MSRKDKLLRRENLIKAAEAAVLLIAAVLPAVFFDYRYAMNDDVFVNAIVSGKYSGTPDIHNVSVGTPLNALFCLLFYISGSVPWFGISMVVCQFFAVYVIVLHLTKKLHADRVCADICVLAVNILLLGLMACELVIIQYTYTAALLMASATLCLYDMEGDFFSRKGLFRFFCVLLQYMFAYCLRTEIFLFLLPFSLLFILIHYDRANGLRPVKKELLKWGFVLGVLFAAVSVLYAVNVRSYAEEGWKEYKLVDAYRTQLYDFLELPAYEENKEFYREAGISRSQYELLDNYNYSLDDKITSDTLRKVVEYADELRISRATGIEKLYLRLFTLPLREGLWSYCHRVLFDPVVAGDDYPWNFVAAVLYLSIIVLTCFSKRWRNLVWLTLLFFMRSGLWMYIILKQRTPARVAHSLFIMEIVCLLALAFEELSRISKSPEAGDRELLAEKVRVEGAGEGRGSGGRFFRKPKAVEPVGAAEGWKGARGLQTGFAVLLLAGACAVAVGSYGNFRDVYEETVAYNEAWEELLAYCREREENFYFMDVYSTVNYTEKMFAGEYSGPDNYDICGGWLAKSPLCAEKYSRFGIRTSVQKALIENDNVYFVAERGRELEWLRLLYEEKGISISVEPRETVAGQFVVYKLLLSTVNSR